MAHAYYGALHHGRHQQPAAAVEQHDRPDHTVEALQQAVVAYLLVVLVGEGVKLRPRGVAEAKGCS